MSNILYAKLRNGVEIPYMSLGAYKLASTQEAMVECLKSAFDAGYYGIDTAAHYGNEELIGKSIKEIGFPREKLFISTKIWNLDQGFDQALKAFEISEKKLGTYFDMLLIHWPCPMKNLYKDTWKALETLYAEGRVKVIGVSNFTIAHMEELRKMGGIIPMVNQIEMHPSFIQNDMLSYCSEYGIQLEAWSPLMRGADISGNDVINNISAKYGRSPAQIILRYLVQLGTCVMVKASSIEHLLQNKEIFEFKLSEDDMSKMRSLNTGTRHWQDPDEYFI